MRIYDAGALEQRPEINTTMTQIIERYSMTRRKRIFYGAIVAGFFFLCLCYALIVNSMAISSTQQTLDQFLQSIDTQIDKNIDFRIKDLKLDLAKHPLPRDADRAAILQTVQNLSRRHPDQEFFVVGPDSVKYDATGRVIGKMNLMHQHEGTSPHDYIIARVQSGNSEEPYVAEIINFPVDSDYHLGRAIKASDFAAALLRDLPIPAAYISIYDHDNTLMAAVNNFENAKERSDVPQTVQQGAWNFFAKNKEYDFQQVGYGFSYNIYSLLDTPEGWFIGAHVPSAKIIPFFANTVTISLIFFLAGLFIILAVIFLDIVNDKEKTREVNKILYIDLLTGLLNELGMQSSLRKFLKENTGPGVSFVVIDLVAFRRINSMFGYATGDKLLRLIGEIIKHHYDVGSRISGDVFSCLVPSAPDVINSMNTLLTDAVTAEMGKGYANVTSFKFGVFPLHNDHHTFGEVYDGAMLALKAAKKTTKQLGVLYDGQLHKQAELQKKIEINMLHALSKEEFLLYIQPKYNLETRQCSGGEALVRWQSEECGMIMPGDFIPLFERNGFIVELDFFMLSAVFEMLRSELANGRTPLPVSINQSRATITFPNYLERIQKLVARYNVPLHYVELEITESFLENDYAAVLSLMYSLKDMGFSLAMDDFGSGYSSLNTLRELPVDVLKIDKNFLEESDNSLRSRKIIRNIINMAMELEISVVCEGVETQTQVDFLTNAGCNYIQGYFFSRPVIHSEYEEKFIYAPSRPTATKVLGEIGSNLQ